MLFPSYRAHEMCRTSLGHVLPSLNRFFNLGKRRYMQPESDETAPQDSPSDGSMMLYDQSIAIIFTVPEAELACS